MCEQLNKYTTTPHSKIGNIKKKSWGDSSSTAKAAFVNEFPIVNFMKLFFKGIL